MSDRATAQNEDEEDRDRGLPLFWGFLLVAAVAVIAVLLFQQIDFSSDPAPDSTGATVSTLAQEPVTTTSTAFELG